MLKMNFLTSLYKTGLKSQISYAYFITESYDGLTVTEMGNGFHVLQDSFDVQQLRTATRFEGGSTVASATCNTAYQQTPSAVTSFSGEIIDEELFCVELDGNTEQVCEVRIENFPFFNLMLY